MPSLTVYTIFFFWTYEIIMYFTKYTEKVNMRVLISLSTILLVMGTLTVYYLFLFGMVYLFQSIITIILSLLYLVFVIQYDNEILTYSMNLGFKLRESRGLKFQMLFICLGLFMFMYALQGYVEINPRV
jgi:hypothetical protein